MTYDEFKTLWQSLNEDQKDSVRAKAAWEGMTLWAGCNAYPDIWNDKDRVATMRAIRKEHGKVVHESPEQILARKLGRSQKRSQPVKP